MFHCADVLFQANGTSGIDTVLCRRETTHFDLENRMCCCYVAHNYSLSIYSCK